MSRNPTFTQAQIRRAIDGARSTGMPVRGFRVTKDGVIEVEFGEPGPVSYGQVEKDLAASWDDA